MRACAVLSFAAVAAGLLAGGVAHAEDLAVEVSGHCPSEAQVRASLPTTGALSRATRLRIVVEREGDVVHVHIVDGSGVAVKRQLRGRDCEALAGAIGVITEGRLLELGV